MVTFGVLQPFAILLCLYLQPATSAARDLSRTQVTPLLSTRHGRERALSDKPAFTQGHVQTREMQGANSTPFQATYLAHFQVFTDDAFCVTTPPVIRVECRGPNMQILNVSHPSIVCDSGVNTYADGISYISCETTCALDDECKDVYLSIGGLSVGGSFGGVEFQCSGTDVSDVEGSMTFDGSLNQVCGSSPQGNSLVYQVAQLGVSCPRNSNSTNAPNNYLYDDYFFECIGLDAFSEQGRAQMTDADRYTCASGNDCHGEACTIDVETLTIQSNLATFQHLCVDPPLPVASPPTRSPTAITSITSNFTARFEAAWGVMYDEETPQLACSPTTPSVRIECLNGDIRLINATDSMQCTNTTQGVLECKDNLGTNTFGRITGVVYECTAPATPETRLEFPEATASCNGNPNPAIVSHAVQLGLSCADGTTYFIDAAFECSNASYSFDYLDAKTASLSVAADRRFSCLQHAAVPSGSTVTIPSVAIQTDDYWRTDPFSTCYTRNTPPPVPTTTVTLSPTSTSLPPTAVPTPTVITSTLDSPSGMPSNAPGEAVTPAPTMAAQKLAPATRAPVSLAPTSIVRSAAPSIRAIASGPMPPLSFPSFDNENTDPDGEILDNKAFVFGVAVGGGTFVLVCAALILYLVVRHCNCHRHSPTNKSSGMATSSHHKFNELLDHDASSKDHSTTTNNKDNRDVEPGRVANHELSETSYSSAPPSPSPSARLHRNLSTPHKTVDYKDQVRSVLPMIHAEPTDATITASAEMVDGGSSNVAATHSHAALSALRYGSENNPAVDLMVTATAMSPPIATPTVNGGRRRALEP